MSSLLYGCDEPLPQPLKGFLIFTCCLAAAQCTGVLNPVADQIFDPDVEAHAINQAYPDLKRRGLEIATAGVRRYRGSDSFRQMVSIQRAYPLGKMYMIVGNLRFDRPPGDTEARIQLNQSAQNVPEDSVLRTYEPDFIKRTSAAFCLNSQVTVSGVTIDGQQVAKINIEASIKGEPLPYICSDGRITFRKRP